MISRVLHSRLLARARKYPVVTVTGPRQSGKTTLCRAAFPSKDYVSFEAPDVRAYASEDPRGFLEAHKDGAILDEIQRVPDLLSYIQTDVDLRPGRGRYILTGSANLTLLASVSQSLAGRTALLNLLPLSLDEIREFGVRRADLYEVMWTGSYPAIFDREINPGEWYPDYTGTYLERDVRTILNVGDLTTFQSFMRLCAGRSAQLLNLSALGSDAGVTHATARAWTSVLEASYVVWRLRPFHSNVRKRLVKTPKLHFYDTGLVCYLLGIRSAGQLRDHPLRGAIFESWVASEILKSRVHRGLEPDMSFFRDRKGAEVDILIEGSERPIAVEAKSGQTIASDFFAPFSELTKLTGKGRKQGGNVDIVIVYGGDSGRTQHGARILPWNRIDKYDWAREKA